MTQLDPVLKEEDDAVLAGFVYNPLMPSRRSVFSKVSTMDTEKIISINNKWDATPQEKTSIINWHRENTESTAKEYIDILFEAEDLDMTDEIITILNFSYEERVALSTEDIYRSMEINKKDGLPIEMAVYLAINKDASDLEEEIKKKQEEEDNFLRKKDAEKITLDNLRRKWDENSK